MPKIINRLKEPSTWAGLSALGMLFGLPPGTMDVVGQAVIALTGAAAVLLPEKTAAERRGTRADRRKVSQNA